MGSAVLEVLWRFRLYRLPTPIPNEPGTYAWFCDISHVCNLGAKFRVSGSGTQATSYLNITRLFVACTLRSPPYNVACV